MQRKHNPALIPVAKVLRKNMTPEEKHLWYDFLSLYPIRFCRQKIIGNYVADFYCAKAKLVVELDGSQHNTPDGIAYDAIRTEFLQQFDLLVLRIPNILIHKDFKSACAYIDDIVQKRIER
ncbi:MAG: DUF559 domain-containing protein [Clostridia bacterium]|nr:DUF559 domain-containing protein [Clostridia bacterium]